MTEEPTRTTRQLSADEMRGLFSEEVATVQVQHMVSTESLVDAKGMEVMTVAQARHQMCQHYGLSATPDEIEAMAKIAKNTTAGFEFTVITAKRLVDESDETTSETMARILTVPRKRRHAIVEPIAPLEAEMLWIGIVADIQDRCWALTDPNPSPARMAERRRLRSRR